MFKWLKKKIKDYQNKRRIKKLPIWFRERLSLDRDWENYDLSDRCILSYDFRTKEEKDDWKEIRQWKRKLSYGVTLRNSLSAKSVNGVSKSLPQKVRACVKRVLMLQTKKKMMALIQISGWKEMV